MWVCSVNPNHRHFHADFKDRIVKEVPVICLTCQQPAVWKEPQLGQMMSVSMTDGTWLEGRYDYDKIAGMSLHEVHRSKQGETGEIRVGTRVFVPWTSIVFVVCEP